MAALLKRVFAEGVSGNSCCVQRSAEPIAGKSLQQALTACAGDMLYFSRLS